MLKKSCVLEYLMTLADTLKQNDGKKALSANYFVISVLKTIDDSENNRLPDELNSDEAKKELKAMREMLRKYSISNNETITAISGAITSPEYKSTMDEFLFSKIHYNAEAKAKKDGRDVIDATVYLELILAEPTETINKCIISHEKTAEEETAPPEISELLEQLRKSLLGDLEDTPEESSQKTESRPAERKPAHKAPVKEGLQDLSDIVQTTRNIQSVLLENVFGQDHAVNAFVSGYFQGQLMARSRKGTAKPQATFLFAGPPGVGKTFLAEKAAEALGLPYKRFDMSEYADKEANLEFCGSDQVYKNGKPGNVTEFVAKNPKCVLLFDEIEKAHINVIYLFLQMLDAGRLRDNYTDTEVSFTNAVIILTTNVGKNLYDDPTVANLSALPRKKVLRSLTTDMDPTTGVPLFPAAICSRFASGNVVMFNHLEASNLYMIAEKELRQNAKGLEDATGIEIEVDDRVPSAIMLAEGGKADARTVKGRANAFFHEELYELLRLLTSGQNGGSVEKLTRIRITVPLEGLPEDVSVLFENPAKPEVLVFADGKNAAECEKKCKDGKFVCHFTDSIEGAKDILFNHDISVILCDVNCGIRDSHVQLLNAEDVSSAGRDFLNYVLDKHSLPVYILQGKDGDISQEEFLSFAKLGVREVLSTGTRGSVFAGRVLEKCRIAYQQSNMIKLSRENKALSFKTSQTVSKSRKIASIQLFDFRLGLITDMEDAKSVLDAASRPDVSFADVIGAEDAKEELQYFVDYLRNPVEYMRKGVRSPRGVLLYGPPGTGKTLLAKAMAKESGVTFLKAEGNQFLKRYIGEGPEAVHDFFNAARKYAPAIVFIDEIDAIGKNRTSSEAAEQTGDILTALLTEMDGFNTDTTKPVFVLAATNYGVDSDAGMSLDPALLRRFDRRIYVDLPNREERKRYLNMKLAKYPSIQVTPEQVDNIAIRSTGMSLADLESIIEMTLRDAIRSKTGTVGDAEFEDAFETYCSGEKREQNPTSLKRTARHEAGHALVCWMGGEKPSYLTVVSRGGYGGYMRFGDHEDKTMYTRAELLHRIRTSLAGRASEIVYYGAEDGISTGASGDLFVATKTAEQMICNYGMDQGVGLSYIDSSTSSGAMSQVVREKVNAMLEAELHNAIRIIEANKQAIDAVVDALIEKSHLKENEIDTIFRQLAVTV